MSQSPEEMQELLGYLKNIKSYERDHLQSERSTIAMIWSIFIFIGGILDGFVSMILGYSPHAIVWFTVIAAAIVAQQIISSQPLLYEKDFSNDLQRESMSLFELISIIIIMGFTTVIGWINPAYVMPYIGLTFGSMNLLAVYRQNVWNFRNVLVVASFYFASLAGLILYWWNTSNIVYSGLVFGVSVGIATFCSGFMSRKQLETK